MIKEWLAKYGDVFLSEDLQNYTASNTPDPSAIFSLVSPMRSPTDGDAHC